MKIQTVPIHASDPGDALDGILKEVDFAALLRNVHCSGPIHQVEYAGVQQVIIDLADAQGNVLGYLTQIKP